MPKKNIIDETNIKKIEIVVRKHKVENYRIDVYLSKKFPLYSRTLLQKFIKNGLVLINAKKAKPGYKISVGDKIHISLPKLILPQMIPENIPLNIIYEDQYFIVVNKPPDFVVHPAAGHWEGTLANALLYHCHYLPQPDDDIYRPGIVHRLDKDTSGVIIAAKTERTHAELSQQFENRTVKKEYHAIVEGVVQLDSDLIDKPIGKHPRIKEKMVITHKGKPARTGYKVIKRFKNFTYLQAFPKTGRTHQIRVHLASIGHPVCADKIYSKHPHISTSMLIKKTPAQDDEIIINRQTLHAYKLTIKHPFTKKKLTFVAELPNDMKKLLNLLEKIKS